MKNQKKLSSVTILLYIFSILFLILFIYFLYSAHEVIASVKDSGQTIETTDIVNTYISGCSPYLFYSLVCYALGHIISSKE